MGYTGLEGGVGGRVSMHRVGFVCFEFPASTKEGSGWVILSGYRARGKRMDNEVGKLSAVKHHKWSHTLDYNLLFCLMTEMCPVSSN